MRTSIENTIVTRLKEYLPQVQVEVYPDDFETFKPNRRSCILVGYTGKTVRLDDNGRSSKRRDYLNVRVTFLYKSRRGNESILEDMNVADNALSGYQIETSFLNFDGEQFITYDQNTQRWVYAQTYTIMKRFDNTQWEQTFLTDDEGNYLTDPATGELVTE